MGSLSYVEGTFFEYPIVFFHFLICDVLAQQCATWAMHHHLENLSIFMHIERAIVATSYLSA